MSSILPKNISNDMSKVCSQSTHVSCINFALGAQQHIQTLLVPHALFVKGRDERYFHHSNFSQPPWFKIKLLQTNPGYFFFYCFAFFVTLPGVRNIITPFFFSPPTNYHPFSKT